MRETRVAQISIFEYFSKHEQGQKLRALSELLDQHTHILSLIEHDIPITGAVLSGRNGLSLDSIFRCLLLKQILRVSFEQLAFHLSDSLSYRSFARLSATQTPCRSTLQSLIRQITPKTLKAIDHGLLKHWHEQRVFSIDQLRIDSTVIASNIAPPSDSQLLNDGVRVISRLLSKSLAVTGCKIRFTDQRKASKSLAFAIFNAKKVTKDKLYPKLLRMAQVVLNQVDRALVDVESRASISPEANTWCDKIKHYQALLKQVMDQTDRRVIQNQKVPSSDKLVSLFEPHTDVIVKGYRDVQYGHKVNLATEKHGFITGFSIEKGNPSDKELYLPVLDEHQKLYGKLPLRTIADGGYASQANVHKGREKGVKAVAFHKPVGLTVQAMGLKNKTLTKLRHFRAGVEGNISELKRAFGATKAKWKGLDGFEAFVWSSVLAYNLVHRVRLKPG